MRRRSFLTMGAGAAGVVAMPRIASAAATSSRAARSAASSHDMAAPDSLRGLAERIGLRIGVAIMLFEGLLSRRQGLQAKQEGDRLP